MIEVDKGMKVVIHDLQEDEFGNLFSDNLENMTIISNNNKINKCIGCFGCWIKTPTTCVIKDDYREMGKLISKSKELIIISKCFYGGLSPFVKNVMDRSISYIQPYFTMRQGEMHHKSRYKEQIKLRVYFYGNNITTNEKETAKKIVAANGINFNVEKHSVYFYNDVEKMRGEVL